MTGALTFLVSLVFLAIVMIVPIFTSADYTGIYGPVTFLDSAQAVLLCALMASIVGLLLCRSKDHRTFLLQLFLAALLVRLLVGSGIFVFNLQAFFGGDAFTYDAFGYLKLQGWMGDNFSGRIAQNYVQKPGTGWGMIYFVAGLYGVIGRNMLASPRLRINLRREISADA